MLISASCGQPPLSSTASGSSGSQIGSSAGKYRRFSSNRSKTEVIHRSPNHTRGRTPCCFSSSGLVSVACSNRVIRVSCHSCLPNRNGEFAASATWMPAIACAAFQYAANASGVTWTCSWTLVHAASGVIDAACVSSCSGPLISMRMSSPRAAKICSLSTLYRSLADRMSSWVCASDSVGRMPIITRRLPVRAAARSAALRLPRTSSSSSATEEPPRRRGGMLISRLNCPTSVDHATGSAIASSTSALRMDGNPSASTRFSSISSPTCGWSVSNSCSLSILANTSSERLTFSRYRRRSSPLIFSGSISRPMPSLLVTYPQGDQAAQVGDEPVVLVRRVHRAHRVDEQRVERRTDHPVVDHLVQVVQRPVTEFQIPPGLEVGVGKRPVGGQLLAVGDPRRVRDLEVLLRRQVKARPAARDEREQGPLDQRLHRPREVVVQAGESHVRTRVRVVDRVDLAGLH